MYFTITFNPQAQSFHCVISLWGGATPSQINSPGSIQVEPPLSDQLPGEHTGQGLPYLGFLVGSMSLFGMYIFHQSTSSASLGDGRLSEPAGSGTRTHHLSYKNQMRYWLSYQTGYTVNGQDTRAKAPLVSYIIQSSCHTKQKQFHPEITDKGPVMSS